MTTLDLLNTLDRPRVLPVLTDAEAGALFPPDSPLAHHCGNCGRPYERYQLDRWARRAGGYCSAACLHGTEPVLRDEDVWPVAVLAGAFLGQGGGQ